VFAVHLPTAAAIPGRRRRRATALVTCHLLLFCLLPAAHAALPGHDGGAAAHACPLCQSFQHGQDAPPAESAGDLVSLPRGARTAVPPVASAPAAPRHDPAAPRAPPVA